MDHIILGILFLAWGVADVLRIELPGILGKRRAAAVLLFLRQSDRHQHHPRGDDTRRRLHPRAVLPLAEAGKREHTGMNHGRKQYGALVL